MLDFLLSLRKRLEQLEQSPRARTVDGQRPIKALQQRLQQAEQAAAAQQPAVEQVQMRQQWARLGNQLRQAKRQQQATASPPPPPAATPPPPVPAPVPAGAPAGAPAANVGGIPGNTVDYTRPLDPAALAAMQTGGAADAAGQPAAPAP